MNEAISKDVIRPLTDSLENHSVYEAINSISDLRIFMEHHIYSVWDFMSLIKYLQNKIAPARYPWTPVGDGDVKRFINELVLEEESDQVYEGNKFSSHFELYISAMDEIGANTRPIKEFIKIVREKGIEEALDSSYIPTPSANFTKQTISYIKRNKPHEAAAALALGREHIIPTIFRSILKKIGVSSEQAPIFHYYLSRHIGLDEDFHAPLSLKLLNQLCKNNMSYREEAIRAAKKSIEARIKFWDGVLETLEVKLQTSSI